MVSHQKTSLIYQLFLLHDCLHFLLRVLRLESLLHYTSLPLISCGILELDVIL